MLKIHLLGEKGNLSQFFVDHLKASSSLVFQHGDLILREILPREKWNLSQFFDAHVERHPLLWPVTQTTHPRVSPEEEGEPITTFQRPPGRLVSYSWLRRPHVQLFFLVEMGNLSQFFGIVPDCSQIQRFHVQFLFS
jgi:hypothetical protein